MGRDLSQKEQGKSGANSIQKSSSNLNIYIIFTASGAAGLIYQVIWARWLGLVFGYTTVSISIVLGSFMLGLAIGSWAIGRVLHRIQDPMRVYAFMELGIGLFAVCFPFFTMGIDHLFTSLAQPNATAVQTLAFKGILSFALLLIPTSLMGATLPLLTDFFRRSPRPTESWKVGILYGANTLGAALGTIVASFVLIELVGIRSTTLAAAVLNFIVAWAGFSFSKNTLLIPPDIVPTSYLKLDGMGKLAVFALTLSGAIAMASEVLWTRTLESIAGNSTYAFAMILVLYLVGIAAGSAVMSLFVNRLKRLPMWLAGLLMAMGIWSVVAIYLFDHICDLLYVYNQAYVTWAIIFKHYLMVMSLLIPLAIFSGAIFPVATRLIDPKSEDAQGKLISKAYAWNTVGALLGSLAGGFLIAPVFDYLKAIHVLAILYAASALIVAMVASLSKSKIQYKHLIAYSMSILCIGLCVFSFMQLKTESRFVTRFNARHPKMEVMRHTPGLQGIVTVARYRNAPLGSLLLVNGTGMTLKATDTKIMAHLPMLMHPDPQHTLVICFGMGTTYRSAITYNHHVTVAELVDEVYDAFDLFYPDAQQVRSYPKGQMITNDGRNVLKLAKQPFDIITVDPPPPIDAAGVNNLYSREFINLAKDHLKPGGIFAHWIPLPGTYGGVNDWTTFEMLVATVADVFPHVYMLRGWKGWGMHVLGSMEPIQVSETLIANHLKNEAVARDLREWDDVPIDYFKKLMPLKEKEFEVFIVTDDRPLLEFNLIRTWRTGAPVVHSEIMW